jgi:hypothetical protein
MGFMAKKKCADSPGPHVCDLLFPMEAPREGSGNRNHRFIYFWNPESSVKSVKQQRRYFRNRKVCSDSVGAILSLFGYLYREVSEKLRAVAFDSFFYIELQWRDGCYIFDYNSRS